MFQIKYHNAPNCLAAGLCPDQLEELTAPPNLYKREGREDRKRRENTADRAGTDYRRTEEVKGQEGGGGE